MTDLYANLSRAKIPVEAHFFAHGVHGVGFAQGDPVRGAWPDLMWNWLRAGGFLTRAPRVAIRGVVTLDGEPLARGSVILTPLDAHVAPPVVAFVFNTGPVRGEFVVPASHGPTPGVSRRGSAGRRTLGEQLARPCHRQAIGEDEEWYAHRR